MATRKLISELGLRYRPSAQADLEEHAASLALLANDVADIPAEYLEAAIAQWVLKSPYMPKASDLTAAAQKILHDRTTKSRPGVNNREQGLTDACARYNIGPMPDGSSGAFDRGLIWKHDGQRMWLESMLDQADAA